MPSLSHAGGPQSLAFESLVATPTDFHSND